jgi:hypothetical protein
MTKDGPPNRGIPQTKKNKRSRLMHVEVPNGDGTTWTKVEDKEEVDNHLIDRNVEQLIHAGTTPFCYTELGKDLGHTGDSDMAENILNGTLEHKCMDNVATSPHC